MRALALSLLVLMVIPQANRSAIRDADAYAIYSALMSSNWLSTDIDTNVLLIQDVAEPARGGRCDLPLERMAQPWHEALAALRQRSANPGVWQPNFTLNLPYRLVPKSTLERFFAPTVMDGWTPFAAAYPDARGFIELSPVGYDRDRSHAVVYVTYMCGGLCGEGGYNFWTRQNGEWRPADPAPGSGYCRWHA